MFRASRDAADALSGLLLQAAKIREALEEWPVASTPEPPDLTGVTERLDRLEVGYAKWEATAEANLLKADALFKNARNAEERTRSKAAKLNEDSEGSLESEEFSRAIERWIQDGDAEGGEGNGMQAMRDGMEPLTPKALAVRAKFR